MRIKRRYTLDTVLRLANPPYSVHRVYSPAGIEICECRQYSHARKIMQALNRSKATK